MTRSLRTQAAMKAPGRASQTAVSTPPGLRTAAAEVQRSSSSLTALTVTRSAVSLGLWPSRDLVKPGRHDVRAARAPGAGSPPAGRRPSEPSTRPGRSWMSGRTSLSGIAGEPPPDPTSHRNCRPERESAAAAAIGSIISRSIASSLGESSGNPVRLSVLFHLAKRPNERCQSLGDGLAHRQTGAIRQAHDLLGNRRHGCLFSPTVRPPRTSRSE